MSLFTFVQLTTKATVADMKATLYAYLEASGISTTSWGSLSPTRVLADAFSRMAAVIQNSQVTANRGGFRDTATGDWLITTSKQMYNVDAISAQFALGEWIAANSGGGLYDLAPGDLTLKNTVTEKTYRNTTTIHIGAGDTGVIIPIQADEVGTESNATPGQVTTLVTTLLGVSGTNLAPVVGQDAEAEVDLRARDLESLGALSPNGPAGAYSYIAKTPSLNGGASVNRVKVLPPPGDGTITIIIASPLGVVPGAEVASVQLGIDQYATPEVATATVISASAYGQGFGTTVYVPSILGVSAADVTTSVQQAIVDYINALPIGGTELVPGAGKILWRSVLGAIENAQVGDIKPVASATLFSEADRVMAQDQVATTDAGSIIVVVVNI